MPTWIVSTTFPTTGDDTPAGNRMVDQKQSTAVLKTEVGDRRPGRQPRRAGRPPLRGVPGVLDPFQPMSKYAVVPTLPEMLVYDDARFSVCVTENQGV